MATSSTDHRSPITDHELSTPDPLLPLIDPKASHVFTLGKQEARLFHQFQKPRTTRHHPTHFYFEEKHHSGDIIAICAMKLARILGLEINANAAFTLGSVALMLRCHDDQRPLEYLLKNSSS